MCETQKTEQESPWHSYRQHSWYEPIVPVNTPPLLCPYMKGNLCQYLKLNKAESLIKSVELNHLFTIMPLYCFRFNNHWKSSKAAGVAPNCCFSFISVALVCFLSLQGWQEVILGNKEHGGRITLLPSCFQHFWFHSGYRMSAFGVFVFTKV